MFAGNSLSRNQREGKEVPFELPCSADFGWFARNKG